MTEFLYHRNSHRFLDFARNDKVGLPDHAFHINLTSQKCLTV